MHYVIGDVHGCYEDMMMLLAKIEELDEDAKIIFVGDFVDRGPQVDKVLEWCMKNITPDGKYQAVRGNHEQMVLDWYMEWLEWWNEEGKFFLDWRRMPESRYDFSRWADGMNILSPEKLEPYGKFFSELPYHKELAISSKWGKRVTFRIVHSCYEYRNVSEDEQHRSNLWKRVTFGNYCSEEIVVHGHTPTVDREYICSDSRDTKPGMISYRHNDINVDGGCVFAEAFPMYPVMLCAIRLEDLEEIYAYSVEDRFMQNIETIIGMEYQSNRLQNYTREYLNVESECRKNILKRLGYSDY